MKIVLLCLMVLLLQVVVAQPPQTKLLIAQETWVIASGASSFRVITASDSLSHWIMAKYEDSLIVRVSYVQKEDRKGKYWERSFYFKNEDYKEIITFIRNPKSHY